MNWGSAEACFAMGGHGPYVWGAYGVALGLMLVEPALAALRYRAALASARDDADDADDAVDPAASDEPRPTRETDT